MSGPSRSAMLSLMLVLLLPLVAVAEEPTAYPVTPLAPEVAEAFRSVRHDPPPRQLIRNTHYWISNEWRHDLFLPQVAGLGGVQLGVGTDQNYLLAGWSRPEVLFLFDFDQAIVDLHRVYGVLFMRSSTPADFLAAWRKEARAGTEAWVRTDLAGDPGLDRIVAVFRRARPVVRGRLVWLRASQRKRKVPTFLDDRTQYDWIRALWFSGRAFPVRGDLTGERALADIAAAARVGRLPIRTLYLSNAEQYFDYGDAFRRNIAQLPADARSVALHTLGWGRLGFADGDYHYLWQSLTGFQSWLRGNRV